MTNSIGAYIVSLAVIIAVTTSSPSLYAKDFNFPFHEILGIEENECPLVLRSIAPPILDIKANGLDGPMTITSGYNLQLSLTLISNDMEGKGVDWWVVANTPFGWYHYDIGAFWLPGLEPTFQGDLLDISQFTILNTAGLPEGSYIFYFGIDSPMDGQLTIDRVYYDMLEVHVINTAGHAAEFSFGIHPSSYENYTYAKDLGINFNREGIYLIWDWVDKEKNGKFSFKNAMAPPSPNKSGKGGPINYDEERKRLLDVEGITMMNNVCPFMGGSQARGKFENESEKYIYSSFIEKLVERYDGDPNLGCTLSPPNCYNPGDNEYPDQELIDILKKNPIKYWQVCNQVTDVCAGTDCAEDLLFAQKYTEVMKLTYEAIKTSCPECQVLIAGDSSKEMYPPVYDILAGKYVDIIDKHFFGVSGKYVKIQEEMHFLKNSLADSGFALDKLRFWITETGTYSGDPIDDKVYPYAEGLPYQTERQQALGLIKRYISSFGCGIEKVLWAWGLKEGFGCDCCIFDYTGLIYNGNLPPQACDKNIYDRGDNIKKLAYYSYKLMTQKLQGFIGVESMQNSRGTYVYKFLTDDNPIYIAWSEKGETVMLPGIGATSIKITESVPNADSGEQVIDFASAFATEIRPVINGCMTISLDETPVFVEMY